MSLDDSTTPAAVHPHSPHLVRILLLSACAVGLTGLGVLGGAASTSSMNASLVRATTVLPSPIRLPAPVVVTLAPHADRSRPLVAKPVPPKVVVPPQWVLPVHASITSPYGMRWGVLHAGCDFGSQYGDPIYAIGNGLVADAGYQSDESGYGQFTIIRHPDGYYSAYAHQSRIIVSPGDHVTAGQIIGYVGATGEATGPHLHFEIRTQEHGHQINPVPWLRAHGVGV